MNHFSGLGRIATDIDVRKVGEKTTIARFNIAIPRNYKNKQTGKYDADFFGCVAFNKNATLLEKYFHKGSRVGISGRLQNNNYKDRDGNMIYKTEISVADIDFCEDRNATAPAPAPKQDKGFMDIPDNIEEEMPFL